MAVNKVVINTENGAETLIDLTHDTITAETLAEGVTAHDASGTSIIGKLIAGGGGGNSLKVTGGIYTPPSNVTADIKINHDLGVKPDFCVWMLATDVSTTALKSINVTGYCVDKPSISSGTLYTTHYQISGYNANGALARTTAVSAGASHTDTTVCIKATSVYRLQAGYGFYWIAGVFS